MNQIHRIIFAGTPDFAEKHLNALIESSHQVVAVLTQPDKPFGRGRKLKSSSVKDLAESANIPVYQPEKLSIETVSILKDLQPDVIVVVAYGLIIPEAILDIPKYGCINVHGSILPAWRGAAPVQRSIMAGDKETGVTIMQMDKGLDTGDMLAIEKVKIGNDDTTTDIFAKLVKAGIRSLIFILNQILSSNVVPLKQDNQKATYAHKITKAEGEINWSKSAVVISQQIRAMNPWPIAWTRMDNIIVRCQSAKIFNDFNGSDSPAGTIIDINQDGLVVTCNTGKITITKIQLPGKKFLPTHEVLKSKKDLFSIGKKFQ